MEKREVIDVVFDVLVALDPDEYLSKHAEAVVDALWSKFILLHQGEKAELPESPSADPTAEGCAICGDRAGFGTIFIELKDGVLLCARCLECQRRTSREAREFWERAAIAVIRTPTERTVNGFPSKSVSEFADVMLSRWMRRFGSRNA